MKNSSGFVLMDSIVSIGIASMIFLATATISTLAAKYRQTHLTKVALQEARNEIYMHMNNEKIAKTLIDANDTIKKCLEDSNFCKDQWSQIDFVISSSLRSPNDHVSLMGFVKGSKGTSVRNGMSMDGSICSTFNEEKPDKNCPFQVIMDWRPLCPKGAPCVDPDFQVRARFVSSLKDKVRINLDSFEIQKFYSVTAEGKPKRNPASLTNPSSGPTSCNSYPIYSGATAPQKPSEVYTHFPSANGTVYIFGVYETSPGSHSVASRHFAKKITVNVTATPPKDTYLTLILSSYEPAAWEITGNTAAVGKVYVMGYHCQELTGPIKDKVIVSYDQGGYNSLGISSSDDYLIGNNNWGPISNANLASMLPTVTNKIVADNSANPATAIRKVTITYSADSAGRTFVAN